MRRNHGGAGWWKSPCPDLGGPRLGNRPGLLDPVERSRDMIAAVKKAGGKPEYTEYKGVGHDSWTRTYKNGEVLDWLFKQKKER